MDMAQFQVMIGKLTQVDNPHSNHFGFGSFYSQHSISHDCRAGVYPQNYLLFYRLNHSITSINVGNPITLSLNILVSSSFNRTDYSYRAAKSLFNNRVKVVIGGSLSPDDNADVNFKENFIDDISLEYYLNQRDNMYIKIFRHTGYESILEGEITQTGVGFVVKKRLLNLMELFRPRKSRKGVNL